MIFHRRAGLRACMGKRWMAILLWAASAASAQTQVDLQTQSKNVDFSSAVTTRPVKLASSLPATCAVGQMIFLTSAPSGANLYACVSANVWALQGSGNLTVKVSDTVVGSRSALNLEPGAGIIAGVSDSGTEIDELLAVDTALVLTKSTAQSGATLLCGSASGSAAAYGCSMSPTLTSAALVRGAIFAWIPDVTCASGGITLNIDSLGAKSVTKSDGVTNPGATDCPSGGLKLVWYDGAVFRLLF